MGIDNLLTAKEAARILGVHEETVYQLIRSGKLRGIKFGRRFVRIDPADLKTFIQQHKSEDKEGRK